MKRNKQLWGILFSLPSLNGSCIFFVIPAVMSLSYFFFNQAAKRQFNGFRVFKALFLKNRLQTEGKTLGLGIYWVIRNIVLFCGIFQLILLEKIRRLWNRINEAIYIKR